MDRKGWMKIGVAVGIAAVGACVLVQRSRQRQAPAAPAAPEEDPYAAAIETHGHAPVEPDRYRHHLPAVEGKLDAVFKLLNTFVPWDKLPPKIGLLNLAAIRDELREENLYDTNGLPNIDPPVPDPWTPEVMVTRTADGSYQDLEEPTMGMRRTRFGRNVPLSEAYPDAEPELLQPNPREVSRVLLARDTFRPATTLNLLAAAWIQFQTHDWFAHDTNVEAGEFEIPLTADDPWQDRPMRVPRTVPDATRPPGDRSGPPSYINLNPHWWDASGIYGVDREASDKLRSWEDGKLIVQDRHIPIDPQTGMAVTGFTDNWWLGLALLHTLFALEHNAICDRLRLEYPSWSDTQLYCRARLINAALIAKIHTVEWTPAILAHPTVKMAMSANWWGLLGERLTRALGRFPGNEMLSGIPGSGVDHHTAPYSLTEEFVAVYRMHPLLPDVLDVHSHTDGSSLGSVGFPDLLFEKANALISETCRIQDLFYTFGTSYPGAITLHNYPEFLRNLHKVDIHGQALHLDLAAVDVLRDRERGVPRYNRFRQLIHKPPVRSFAEITPNAQWARELRDLYDNDLDRVDTMVGMFAEEPPPGFGFSDTAFRIFILMASRRLKSDRFFAGGITPEIYTQRGVEWIDSNDMRSVLIRHYPELTPFLGDVNLTNAFAPWPKMS